MQCSLQDGVNRTSARRACPNSEPRATEAWAWAVGQGGGLSAFIHLRFFMRFVWQGTNAATYMNGYICIQALSNEFALSCKPDRGGRVPRGRTNLPNVGFMQDYKDAVYEAGPEGQVCRRLAFAVSSRNRKSSQPAC